ncbi:helix-turn-helix domain-containing protein [Bradyrhizobium sp. MOS002]|uniref:helix-turn-helix domain-containing protein n=1 Tax=Bradyrhizobium sp. MOS002 TaxID=2133947 RepID=UPI000D1313FF|nr:helix-turn-helix domain-containing protein [Bradyrhizobium sp. MOS002]PSO25195.1 excisionase [Bradyrhizobium sp. MOS002]
MDKSHTSTPAIAGGGYDLLSLDEAARRLGVSRAFLRRKLTADRLTVVRFGRLLRIPPTTLDEIVEHGRRPFSPHSVGDER